MSKNFLTSKTILGILLAAVAWANQRFNLGLTGADGEQTASDIATILGLAIAVYGRFAAKKDLTLGGPGGTLPCIVIAFALLTGCTSLPMPVKARVEYRDGKNVIGVESDGKSAVLFGNFAQPATR